MFMTDVLWQTRKEVFRGSKERLIKLFNLTSMVNKHGNPPCNYQVVVKSQDSTWLLMVLTLLFETCSR